MVTGDEIFTKIHIEASLEQCAVFVELNTTFKQTEPEITYRIETFCQNNCSEHGICNAGNCTCDEGFAGSDCSFDLLGPPNITHISNFGLCDKSLESCDEITLFGKYFIENMQTNCYMQRNTVREDRTVMSVKEYDVSLQERTLVEGFCPLEYSSNNHWVTEFTFNISNDGSRFTENFHVYTYQSLCQEYRNDTGNITFVFKEGYCYINNTCVADGSTNKNNVCDICSTAKSKYDWSFNTDHCFISGECYKSGDIDGTNPCSICDPSLTTIAWTPNPNLCFINGMCYLDGQTEQDGECNVCNATISRTMWTLHYNCISKEIPQLTTTVASFTTPYQTQTLSSEPSSTSIIEQTSTTIKKLSTTVSTEFFKTTTYPTSTTTTEPTTSPITTEPTTKTKTEPTTTTNTTKQTTTTLNEPTSTILTLPASPTTTTEPTTTTTTEPTTSTESYTKKKLNQL